jgi:hypothetical protein
MAKQTFTTGQVLTAAQMTSLQETAMGGGPATAKTTSYVLVAADAGTTVAMNAAGATTITVNTGLFAAGDTVFIQNLGAGACTITAGTATVATAGSLILPQNDAGILYFTATGAAIFYDYIQAGAVSPLTTKGDLYTFSTSDARLGVGANGTTLVADSAEATGLKWATPASGGMTLIAETVANADTGISYTSLGSYKQLLLMYSGLYQSDSSAFSLRLNNDSSSIYQTQQFGFDNSGVMVEYNNDTDAVGNSQRTSFGKSVANTKNNRVQGQILIDNYTSTSKFKLCIWQVTYNNTGHAKVSMNVHTMYESTNAITSLDIVRFTGSGTLSNSSNTSIRLYGIS